ncbi:MAG: endolytic transglycosylase MltG [Syntrophales bacterium]|nr:endolytic transglycosylase MltG [Syntrophales bacterium]
MKVHKIFVFAAALVLLSALTAGGFLYRYAQGPLNTEIQSVIITIPRGAPFYNIAAMLEEEGLLRSKKAFYIVARLKGAHNTLKAGEYEIKGGESPSTVIERLRRGDVVVHFITVPEGFTIYQVAERLAAHGLADAEVFLERVHDVSLLSSMGIDAASAEGYLFPDTYALTRSKNEEAIIRFMVRSFREAVPADMADKAQLMGFTLKEILTLASIIEKESATEEEKPLISSVFHNRLKRGMRLQSDPTVTYGLDEFEGRIRKRDLERYTPYNTYRIRGLPPGPICNPGLSSIKAALEPADVNYLYFVSRNDGTHHFSSNLSDHNKAVIKYQIKRQK